MKAEMSVGAELGGTSKAGEQEFIFDLEMGR